MFWIFAFALLVLLPVVAGFYGGWFLPKWPYRILLTISFMITLIGVAITLLPALMPASGHVSPDETYVDGFIRFWTSIAIILAGLSLGASAALGHSLSR